MSAIERPRDDVPVKPILIGLAALPVLKLVHALYKQYLRRPSCPGPRQWPILGNTVEVLKRYELLLDYFEELAEQYGDTVRLKILGQPHCILSTDPETVEYMLKTKFDNFVKGEMIYVRFKELLGNGIFNVDGDLWYHQRKTAAPMFTEHNFRELMLTSFLDRGQKLLDILSKSRDSKQPVDMMKLMYRFTLDGIGLIGFGLDLKSMENPHSEFADAFDAAQVICAERFFGVWSPFLAWFQPKEYRYVKCIQTLRKTADAVVAERLSEPAEKLAQRNDFLSMFVKVKNDKGEPLYDKIFLRDVVLNFLIAGRDTSAGALSWTFYCLTQYPEVTAKLCKEVDRVLAETGETETSLTLETLRRRMPYLNAVVHEVLRLYPSVPKEGKVALSDDRLPNGTFVPKGTFVSFLPYVMGRQKKIWGPDAKVFRPERWLEELEDGQWHFKPKPSAFEFIAFNAGRRTCLGMDMALLQMTLVVAIVMHRFRLELVPGHKVVYQTTVTLPLRYGLPVTVHDRPQTA